MSSQRFSHETLKSIQESLILHKEIFVVTRHCTIDRMNATADLMERQMRGIGIGKVTGAAASTGGSLAIGATGLATATGVLAGPVAAPILAIGSVTLALGSLTTAGAEFFRIRKSRRSLKNIEGTLINERGDMEKLAIDMKRLPLRGSLPRQALEAANMLQKSLALAALGISCSPDNVAQRAELIDQVVGGVEEGLSLATEADMVSKAAKLQIPGLTELASQGGLASAFEEGGTYVMELVTGGAAGVKAFLLPYFVVKLVKRSIDLRRGSYRDGANIVRAAAKKLGSDGAKWLEQQHQLIESVDAQCRIAAKREKIQTAFSSLRRRARSFYNDDSNEHSGDDSNYAAGNDSSYDYYADSVENFFRRHFGL